MNVASHPLVWKRPWHVVLACCVLFVGAFSTQAPADSTVSIMPLGDSLTWGYNGSLTDPATPGGYRDPLYGMLLNGGVDASYVGANNGNPGPLLTTPSLTAQNGYSGYTIAQIQNNLAGSDTSNVISNAGGYWLSGNPATGQAPESANIILLMIGTNDITQNIDPLYNATLDGPMTNALFGQQTAQRVVSLVQEIRQYEPNSLILVAGAPPAYGYDVKVEPFDLNLQADINAGQAGANVDYVDMFTPFWTTSTWASGGGSDNLAAYFDASGGNVPDGIHPNTAGYDLMAQTWDNAIMADYDFSEVPEPSTYALFLGGAMALLGWRKLRLRKS